MADPGVVLGGTPPNESRYFVALAQEQFGQIGTVLTGDTGNQSSLGHDKSSTKGHNCPNNFESQLYYWARNVTLAITFTRGPNRACEFSPWRH
jgi:hypothetical protein